MNIKGFFRKASRRAWKNRKNNPEKRAERARRWLDKAPCFGYNSEIVNILELLYPFLMKIREQSVREEVSNVISGCQSSSFAWTGFERE